MSENYGICNRRRRRSNMFIKLQTTLSLVASMSNTLSLVASNVALLQLSDLVHTARLHCMVAQHMVVLVQA